MVLPESGPPMLLDTGCHWEGHIPHKMKCQTCRGERCLLCIGQGLTPIFPNEILFRGGPGRLYIEASDDPSLGDHWCWPIFFVAVFRLCLFVQAHYPEQWGTKNTYNHLAESIFTNITKCGIDAMVFLSQYPCQVLDTQASMSWVVADGQLQYLSIYLLLSMTLICRCTLKNGMAYTFSGVFMLLHLQLLCSRILFFGPRPLTSKFAYLGSVYLRCSRS